MIEKELLDKLKAELPKRYARVIVSRTGCALSTVFNVMRGDSDNREVLTALLDLADEHQQKEQALKARLDAVLTKS